MENMTNDMKIREFVEALPLWVPNESKACKSFPKELMHLYRIAPVIDCVGQVCTHAALLSTPYYYICNSDRPEYISTKRYILDLLANNDPISAVAESLLNYNDLGWGKNREENEIFMYNLRRAD